MALLLRSHVQKCHHARLHSTRLQRELLQVRLLHRLIMPRMACARITPVDSMMLKLGLRNSIPNPRAAHLGKVPSLCLTKWHPRDAVVHVSWMTVVQSPFAPNKPLFDRIVGCTIFVACTDAKGCLREDGRDVADCALCTLQLSLLVSLHGAQRGGECVCRTTAIAERRVVKQYHMSLRSMLFCDWNDAFIPIQQTP